jgi:hypothetical protein
MGVGKWMDRGVIDTDYSRLRVGFERRWTGLDSRESG